MNQTIKNLTERTSCKSYKTEHISHEEVETIVSAGLNAPSGMNKQTPIFVAIQDDKTVAELSKLNAGIMGANIDPFYGAKDVVVVLAKKEGTYIYDGSLAMGNLLNAAWAIGVDACWIHRAKEVFDSPEGKKLLKKWKITEDVEGIGFCVLGHALKKKEKTQIKPNRVFYI